MPHAQSNLKFCDFPYLLLALYKDFCIVHFMQHRKLGKTDINVSLICLGTMTWGEQNTEKDAHSQLNMAVEMGVNFIDTAEMYPVPPRAETQGRTESYIGTWLKGRKDRDKLIIASKVIGKSDEFKYIRGGRARLDKENIENALNDSLKRLNTDYLDLYQLHWPDRETNNFGQLGYTHMESEGDVLLEETLETLGKIVKSGKIRHLGISNETPWGMMRFMELSASNRLPRMVSIQNPYNLLNRSFEIGLAECAIREECGLLAYSPLAFGVLSGKYLGGNKPSGSRLSLFTRFQRYTGLKAQQATSRYVAVAKEAGLDPAQMALAYVNSRPFLTSNIIGATSVEQLKDNIESSEIKLPDEVLQQIEQIHADIPNPCP